MKISISKLNSSDLNEVKKLLIESFSLNYKKKINLNALSDSNSVFIVAKDGQAIVGYASLHLLNKLNRKTGLIEDVAVNKKYRGLGIGKLIVNKLIELSKENNCDKIILNSNEEYLNFYKKIGFNKEGFQMVIKL